MSMQRLVSLLALGAMQAEAQTFEQQAFFKQFALAMAPYEVKFEWKPVQMITSDGYILTSFVISLLQSEPIYNPPVIVHHGNGWDAQTWLSALNNERGTPLPIELARQGYYVWLMNQRGTEYSRGHTRLSPDSKEYWDFDQFDLWRDIEANIRVIKAYQGFDDFWYVGYSGATTQMLYALVDHAPKLQDKLRKAILLAPCTTPKFEPPGALKIWESSIDVYEFSGDDWSDGKAKACTVINESTCDSLNYYDKLESTSVKSNAHLAQLGETKKFQKFVKKWPGSKRGVEIDLSSIRGVQISMFVDQFDNVCQALYAQRARDELYRVMDNYEVISDNRGHSYFVETNEYAKDVAREISIESGEAKKLYFLAQDHLRRTGGYDNPADNLSENSDGASTLAVINMALFALLSSVLA